VHPDELDAFFLRYAESCRAGMSGLKKRDKKKGKKDKKKKKKGVGEMKV
jgi:signal recognition particle subunit SRP14